MLEASDSENMISGGAASRRGLLSAIPSGTWTMMLLGWISGASVNS